MAYTPPSGNAVAFQLTGVAYTAPSGSGVDFVYAIPTGTISAALPLASHFFCSIDIAPVAALVKGNLPFVGVFTADTPTCAAINAAIALSGDIDGAGAVAGRLSGTLRLTGSLAAVPATVANLAGRLPISGQISGWSPYSASLATRIPLTGEVVGAAVLVSVGDP